MQLICTQENFKKAIFNSERIVSKQNTLPILNNILFETEKGILKIIATNLEIGIISKIGAKIEKDGKITIPAKLISNFINNLPSEENIQIEVDNQNLKIKSGLSKAIIKGLLADDFPLLPRKNKKYLLKINSFLLKNSINKLVSCVAINEMRQELTGINLVLAENELFFAATDSFRLIEEKIIIKKEDKGDNYEEFVLKNENIIIPASTLIELGRIIGNDSNGEVEITIDDGQIFFELDNVFMVSRLINGKYPDYKHIIPKTFETRVIVNKNNIQGAIKMASVFSKIKNSEIVFKIDSEANKFTIEAKSVDVGENSTELNMELVGQPQRVIFNSKYVLDGISIINTSKVAILFNNESSPVAIKEVDEKSGEIKEDYVYIVMPIKGE